MRKVSPPTEFPNVNEKVELTKNETRTSAFDVENVDTLEMIEFDTTGTKELVKLVSKRRI